MRISQQTSEVNASARGALISREAQAEIAGHVLRLARRFAPDDQLEGVLGILNAALVASAVVAGGCFARDEGCDQPPASECITAVLGHLNEQHSAKEGIAA